MTEHVKEKMGTTMGVVAALERYGRVMWCYKLPCSVSAAGKWD